MILQKLSLINFKNIREATLDLSPKMNCFIGNNGAGKTNILDAIYFLSFTKSSHHSQDKLMITHEQNFFVIEGNYIKEDGEQLSIYCGVKQGEQKVFRNGENTYKRLSEHIGTIPIVLVTPSDSNLIEGMSDERRHFMDVVISQYDKDYLYSLSKYNKALQNRNSTLKIDETGESTADMLCIYEEIMAEEGEKIYTARNAFVEEFTPVFRNLYREISQDKERVNINYVSHCQRGPLLQIIQQDRRKDLLLGCSLHGIHRDDLEMTIGAQSMKREGSQGQNKTCAIALKLAQFQFLKRTKANTTPILLLDDIFDKLDAGRVEQIVNIVSGNDFGQIFITDTNRSHLDKILQRGTSDYKIFQVTDGKCSEKM